MALLLGGRPGSTRSPSSEFHPTPTSRDTQHFFSLLLPLIHAGTHITRGFSAGMQFLKEGK